jgi:CheY-like chemotaxis protein
MRKENDAPHGAPYDEQSGAAGSGKAAEAGAPDAAFTRAAGLEQAGKPEALSQLMGGVAHGFNNVLTVILGNMELLQMRLVGDAVGLRHVSNALEGARRGIELTQRMLAFARRENPEPGVVDLNEAAREIIAALRRVLGPGVEVRTEFARQLWPVRADLRQLEFALVNLARNAGEAMLGEGRLTLSAYNETVTQPGDELAAGEYVRLIVADTGVGMSAATLARAMDPFFTTKETGAGAGLGLPMVQGFAVQSGGALRLSSKLGEGAKAELWLPRAAELIKARPLASAAVSEPSRPCTVLVVDDDALIVMVTSDRLQALGCHVFEVQSGRQALEVLRGGARIDVVLTDHVMPGMTGVELAREIRVDWPDLPIILATGCADLPDVAELRLTRLDKPYDLDALAETIYELTREKCAC